VVSVTAPLDTRERLAARKGKARVIIAKESTYAEEEG
jgi:hypothetical protein